MRNLISVFIILLLGSACTGPSSTVNTPLAYDPGPDIERFLDTADPAEETKILARLKESKVSNDSIKAYLRKNAIGSHELSGLFLGVPVKHMGKELTYSLYVPESAQEGLPLPMIVILHGMGGSGDTTLQSWRKRLNDEFIILCPSYPMGAWWTLSAEELVLQLMRETKMRVPVDPNRIFLAGLSNGALGAYMIGSFYPDYFAAIIPIAGAISEPHYLHFLINLTNTPLYSIQGKYDPIFPVRFSHRINKILSDMKYPLTYREHTEKGAAHGGHFLPESEVPALLEWLREQRREPYSTTIRMVREGNHLDRIQWARVTRGLNMAALQIPGPLPESMNVKDGKATTLIAVHKKPNLFEITGKNLLEMELYLDADRVDFDQPVMVTFQEMKELEGKVIIEQKLVKYHGKVARDTALLLREFKMRRDPEQLYDAKITVVLEKGSQFAMKP
ncbi:MAG TPA: PHB depolymerase family esterase [Desulfobacteria bacterium]|nr:PHB depolymerase family esterase [Desulfobacteria bacterium]